MSIEPHCHICGLVEKGVCGSAEDAAECPHAPVEARAPIIGRGPFKGMPRRRYGTILADPPWSYKTFSNRDQGTVPHRSPEAPYAAMTAEELLALPVNDVAADDCVLHMWVISSHLDQALALGAAWGFTFKSLGMVWVKTQKSDPEAPKMGMGKWFRQEAEICLLFTKGKPKRASAGVRQVILEPAREHSRKPDESISRVEALSDGPYLELFSRADRKGWDAWGNETGKFTSDAVRQAAKPLTEAVSQIDLEDAIWEKEIEDLV